MNLQEQIGALADGVDQLLEAAAVRNARMSEAAQDGTSADGADAVNAAEAAEIAEVGQETPAADAAAAVDAATDEQASDAPSEAQATLQVARPSQNEITMTIGGETVSLNALQIGQLIEELAYARASMQPEPPPGIPPGWRFVSTKNPAMAVQKQANGDRLLVLRHTGHGWVPFTFSPDMVIQMYMMLTQR
jgi:hypothetical protein